jgi:hypothetical protein
MLRELNVTQLVQQFALLGPGDKSAVSKLLGAREQYILKELMRRHQYREKSRHQGPNSSNGDAFIQCSSWLSRALFDLLDQEHMDSMQEGPTPAVRALVRDIYVSVGGNVELSGQEARSEQKSGSFVRGLMTGWLGKSK